LDFYSERRQFVYNNTGLGGLTWIDPKDEGHKRILERYRKRCPEVCSEFYIEYRSFVCADGNVKGISIYYKGKEVFDSHKIFGDARVGRSWFWSRIRKYTPNGWITLLNGFYERALKADYPDLEAQRMHAVSESLREEDELNRVLHRRKSEAGAGS
jgi:hypothetical protein